MARRFLASSPAQDDPPFKRAFLPVKARAKGLQLTACLKGRRAILGASAEARAEAQGSGLASPAGAGPAGAVLLARRRLGWSMDTVRPVKGDPDRTVDRMASSRRAIRARPS